MSKPLGFAKVAFAGITAWAGLAGFLLSVGCIATAFSAIAAIGLVLVFLHPLALLALLLSPILLQAVWLALLLASPTTMSFCLLRQV